MPLLSDLLDGTLDLVFAPTCVACGSAIPTRAADRAVCAHCWIRMRPLPLPRCERCWTPLPPSGPGIPASCRICPTLRPALRAVRSVFHLAGPVRSVVHALKYRGWHALGHCLGERMAALVWPREVEAEVRWVVPVPLTSARIRQRGYNQAALLGERIAALRGWRSRSDILVRGTSGGSQTTLHPGERRANVAHAFRTAAGLDRVLADEHLLLVDDVWTTGATALACTEALLAAGARAVSVATFARALPELDRHAGAPGPS